MQHSLPISPAAAATVSDYTALLAYRDSEAYRFNSQFSPGRPVVVSYAFMDSDDLPKLADYNPYEATGYFSYSTTQREAFRLAAKVLEKTAGIIMTEKTDTPAMINIGNASGTDYAGWAHYPYSWAWGVGMSYLFTDFARGTSYAPGTPAFQVILHELGHAVGLKHPFEGETQLSDRYDTTAHTLMSYTSDGTRYRDYRKLDTEALTHLYGQAVDKTGWVYSYTGEVFSLKASGRSEFLNATPDRSRIEAGAGHDTLNGGQSGDTLLGGEGNDLIYGGLGGDRLSGGAGNDTIWGDYDFSGNFSSASKPDTLMGDAGHDRLYGGNEADWLYGGDGNDRLFGGGSADGVWNDRLYGGNGNDYLADNDGGNDLMLGDAGNDTIHGGSGYDTLYGKAGNDSIQGGPGNDRLYGGKGNDTLQGSGPGDKYYGADLLDGGEGNDALRTYSYSAELIGGNGNDTLLIDGSLSASARGGNGNDRLTVVNGANATLRGGAGDDEFILNGASHLLRFDTRADAGRDVVRGFSLVNDRIELLGPGHEVSYHRAANNRLLIEAGAVEVLFADVNFSARDSLIFV